MEFQACAIKAFLAWRWRRGLVSHQSIFTFHWSNLLVPCGASLWKACHLKSSSLLLRETICDTICIPHDRLRLLWQGIHLQVKATIAERLTPSDIWNITPLQERLTSAATWKRQLLSINTLSTFVRFFNQRKQSLAMSVFSWQAHVTSRLQNSIEF